MPSLYKYQEEGVSRLLQAFRTQKGALLADDQGLGKSAQAVEVANHLAPRRVLVICPTSLKINWQREFALWGIWGICPEIITTRTKNIDQIPDIDVNYDIVHRIPALLDQEFDLVLCDESHYLKNKSSKRSKAVAAIADKAKHVLLMSGTPMTNRPVELWHQMRVMGWVGPKTFTKYTKDFCDYKRKIIYTKRGPKPVIDVSGASNLPELKAVLTKYGMVRRTKMEVLTELPPKTFQILELPRQKQWRSSLLQSAMGDPVKKGQVAYFKSLAEIAAKTGDRSKLVETLAEARRIDGVEKAAQVAQFVEDKLEGGVEKVIIFACHVQVIEDLTLALKKYNPVQIYGKTPNAQRQKNVDAFQGDPKVRVIIGHILSMGTGWTLTAAHHAIFAEIDWDLGAMAQASDRPHRIGQKENVTIQYLVFEDSTDAIVAKSLVAKQETLDAVFDSDKPLDAVDTLI